jgi:hypothetical protein
VDVTVIQSWLGHAQLDTTNHYAQANLETKRKARRLWIGVDVFTATTTLTWALFSELEIRSWSVCMS